jgi:hypothetical protein
VSSLATVSVTHPWAIAPESVTQAGKAGYAPSCGHAHGNPRGSLSHTGDDAGSNRIRASPDRRPTRPTHPESTLPRTSTRNCPSFLGERCATAHGGPQGLRTSRHGVVALHSEAGKSVRFGQESSSCDSA